MISGRRRQRRMTPWAGPLASGAALWLGLSAPGVAAPTLSISYAPGLDLRAIAETYLGDADLWPSILKSTGLAGLAELRPGLALTIPVGAVEETRSALTRSLERIQEANAIGAQVFAFEDISRAIALHDQALDLQKAGEWSQALALASESGTAAQAAFAIAEQNRDQAAEARLSDRQGWVEGQRPEDLGWGERPLNAILVEEEKVRTLSRSTAQITFRDAGRLRLNANSHAVIERMRVDPLKKREDAKVSLVEGDFYALLGGNSSRKNLKVDVPDVEAKIDSGDFWVRQDVSGAKFTNYDDQKVQIAARGDTVALGRNEGVVIRSGEQPRAKIDLLGAPVLVAPPDDGVVFNSEVQLAWQTDPAASGYWIEIALDPGFNTMVRSASGLADAGYTTGDLQAGLYYWRVSALDRFGLPGQRSQTRRFDMRIDTAPPFLRIEAPASESILREPSVEVRGESEAGAEVSVNGVPAAVAADGSYSVTVTAREGLNRLDIVARDAAGNETAAIREFVHMPDAAATVVFDERLARLSARHFLAPAREITLSGTTTADARLDVVDAAGAVRASTTSAHDGRFGITVALAADSERFGLVIVAPSGFESRDGFEASVDREPPTIRLDAPLPRLTSVEWLALRGRIQGGGTATLNGRPIPLAEGTFDEVITLVAGANAIEMTATDAAGNVAVERWSVTLDQEPPSYVRHSVEARPDGRVEVEVVAEDGTGLAKAAPFTVLANGEAHQGFLRYNKLSRSYKGTVAVAAGQAGRATLAEVELEDDAGNRARVRIR
ncbi:FecR domain-containing protein [Polymorphum gilvum]|uniref:FecR protein domain-containing protein n=1 Tax=Polymorphum gilvum (strain LMG 25793 / CGMCC 1.9160 / SL003B-26A1) TaxID=991905 RepID=F2J1S4_POLGS|nr:FecR domain-containing protein [Polymorphum gilvum]ADZ71985.1 hypothetical protein SL003B_3563 [Polymorphum gilvum SL003B-26A1]